MPTREIRSVFKAMILSPKPVEGKFVFREVARDKSLSHRSVIFAFLCNQESKIENFLQSADTLATLEIAKTLGMCVRQDGKTLTLFPPKQIQIPSNPLQCHNSGTTMRLYLGLLASVEGKFGFDGDKSLRKRPMQRVRDFLEPMGVGFDSPAPLYAPFVLRGGALKGVSYKSRVASAQVKSAFLLATLGAGLWGKFIEPERSRDHSERMLLAMGADLKIFENHEGYGVEVFPSRLKGLHFEIPNDPSSVFFLIVGCLIAKDLTFVFKDVLLNPTRIYAFEILKKMGAQIKWEVQSQKIEPVGEVWVHSSVLCGVEVHEHIAWLIDEIPALCIAFACAKGVSRVRGAKELRYKESDRLKVVTDNLLTLGIKVKTFEDGLEIEGGEFLESKSVRSFGDHRIAMSFALVGLQKRIEIEGVECVSISFPRFFEILDLFVEQENGS